MAEELLVFLSGESVGLIQRMPGDRYRFSYHDDYRRGGRVPLSPTVPIGAGPFRSERIGAYLEGLIPEKDEVREGWAAELGTGSDAFDLLGAMGLDCVGAVQFVQPGRENDLSDRNAEYRRWTDRMISERLHSLRELGASWTLPGEHWSLPGAQDKFTLAYHRGQWFEPQGAGSSTHIVKPGIHRLYHQAALEHATMRVARRLGLRVADTQLCDFGGEFAVVVKRFDRVSVGGKVRRLHQVDFCQAMGRLPRNKYEERNGPRTQALAEMIRRESAAPEEDVSRFSDAVMFNYIVGAPDGHSKNFALLYRPDGRARMAPLYDLSTAFAYEFRGGGYDLTGVAMSIGGRRKFGQVIEKNWIRHAHEMGLDPDERMQRASQMASTVTDAFRDELAELGTPGLELANRLLPRLAKHAAETAHRVAKTASGAHPGISLTGIPYRSTTAHGTGQNRDARGRFAPGGQPPQGETPFDPDNLGCPPGRGAIR